MPTISLTANFSTKPVYKADLSNALFNLRAEPIKMKHSLYNG